MINKLLAVAFVALAVAASGCGSSSSSSSSTPPASSGGAADCSPASLQTLTSGKLTIGTDNPAYSPYFTGGPGTCVVGQVQQRPVHRQGLRGRGRLRRGREDGLHQGSGDVGRHALRPELRARAEELRLLPGAGLDPAQARRERRLQPALLPRQPGGGGAEGHPDHLGHDAGRPQAVQAGHAGGHHQLRLHHRHDPAQPAAVGVQHHQRRDPCAAGRPDRRHRGRSAHRLLHDGACRSPRARWSGSSRRRRAATSGAW